MRFYSINSLLMNDSIQNYIKENYPLRYKKAKKYVNENDYLNCIAAYYLLDKAIGKFDEKAMKYTKNGKPSLDGYPFFNYSHSGNTVVLVVDKKHEVGIDIEMFNGRDKSYIKQWTRDEATVKLTGEGIGPHSRIPLTYKNKLIKVITKKRTSDYIVSIASIN